MHILDDYKRISVKAYSSSQVVIGSTLNIFLFTELRKSFLQTQYHLDALLTAHAAKNSILLHHDWSLTLAVDPSFSKTSLASKMSTVNVANLLEYRATPSKDLSKWSSGLPKSCPGQTSRSRAWLGMDRREGRLSLALILQFR